MLVQPLCEAWFEQVCRISRLLQLLPSFKQRSFKRYHSRPIAASEGDGIVALAVVVCWKLHGSWELIRRTRVWFFLYVGFLLVCLFVDFLLVYWFLACLLARWVFACLLVFACFDVYSRVDFLLAGFCLRGGIFIFCLKFRRINLIKFSPALSTFFTISIAAK